MMSETNSILIITHRGWPGHYILGHRCVFHLNTLIELGDMRIVVSTVGLLLRRDNNGDRYETIGHDRHFETLAFHAKQDAVGFWDADVSRQISFESEWSWRNIEDEPRANDGHFKVVDEITKRLLRGEFNTRFDSEYEQLLKLYESFAEVVNEACDNLNSNDTETGADEPLVQIQKLTEQICDLLDQYYERRKYGKG